MRFSFLVLFLGVNPFLVYGALDISTVKPDLVIPSLTKGRPAAGKRVKQTHPDWRDTKVYHVIYLPKDWRPDKRYPVIVEYAGNGPYKNKFGDTSAGRPESSKMGYGISGGEGFIWVCIPYLNESANKNAIRWWGDHPIHNPKPTLDYCKKLVPWVCANYGGEVKNVVLCGFSRGAIACNYLGLYDDDIAKLWRAFIPYSHYDGVKRWPYPGSDKESALIRLKRLKGRPQFICHEGKGVSETQRFLTSAEIEGQFIFQATGFRNHSDGWLLRPSPARALMREWLAKFLKN